MRLTLSQKRAEAGKKGGDANASNHSHDYFVELGREAGKAGGRPRNLSLSELRALKNITEKGGELGHRNSFNLDLVGSY